MRAYTRGSKGWLEDTVQHPWTRFHFLNSAIKNTNLSNDRLPSVRKSPSRIDGCVSIIFLQLIDVHHGLHECMKELCVLTSLAVIGEFSKKGASNFRWGAKSLRGRPNWSKGIIECRWELESEFIVYISVNSTTK